ncbi:MAG: bifunctional folylpolyglutamate synthase/dihydrofolate synthase, partial [Betaproteobacteria bacterium]|nr:bifunctional folylpolyglutamate synthase/dihydrofolate synthase [Betaproteobacteria bacterium]
MARTALTGARFAEAVRYLTMRPDLERGVPGSTLSLEGIRIRLDAMDHPDDRYPSVLIAGSKGKGSTAAMIERGLRAAGYRTGLYTQPDLHTIRERVRIDGEPIDTYDFSDGIEVVRAAADRAGRSSAFTTYELLTAMALERFATHHVDVAVLEVGLGGRLDATNVVAATISVLTSISLDHTRILGDTVAAIAREKADIIKVGRPVISAPQPPEAMAVIREKAAERSAPLVVAAGTGAHWQDFPRECWNLLSEAGRLDGVRLSLRGGFQRINGA